MELREEKELVETTPVDSRYTIPTHAVSDHCVLVTVAGEDTRQGHLPSWGHPGQRDLEETYLAPLSATDHDSSWGLDADEHGAYVELCLRHVESRIVRTAAPPAQRHVRSPSASSCDYCFKASCRCEGKRPPREIRDAG